MKQNYSSSLLIRLLAIGISSVGTLLLLPLVLNKLGEYNLGIWGMVSAITGYLLLLDFGIALACTRYLSIQHDSTKNWTSIISNSLALSGLICIALLVLASLPLILAMDSISLLAEQHKIISAIIAVVMIEVALSIPLRMYLSILRTEVRYLDIGLFEVIRVILRVGGIILALVLGAQLLEIVILASAVNLLFYLLPCLSVWQRHKSLFFSTKAIKLPVIKELLQFSKFTAVSQMAEFLKFRTDSVLVALVLGITVSAHYTIIVFIVMMLTQILMRFLSYWDTIIIRHIGNNDQQSALDTVFRSLAIGIWITSLAILNTIIFGQTFISLWMGDAYAFLHNPLILLSLVLFGITSQMATTPYFNAIKQEKTNAKLDLYEVLLKLLLIIPFSLWFGLSGFILAIVLSSGFISIALRQYHLYQHSDLVKNALLSKLAALSVRPLLVTVATLITYFILTKHAKLDAWQVQLLSIPLQLSLIGLALRKQLRLYYKPTAKTLSSPM